jgi:ketosteroid isomerase-like protein
MDDPLTAELYRREVEAWEIFKRKDNQAYAQGIADDAIGFDLSGERVKDKAATVNDINAADVWTHYEIRDFKAESIAPDVALVHYLATVGGITAGGRSKLRYSSGKSLSGVAANGWCATSKIRQQSKPNPPPPPPLPCPPDVACVTTRSKSPRQ